MPENNRNAEPKQMMKLLGCVDRAHRALIEAKVEDLGLHRTQHMMIMQIARNEGIAQNELARAFDISPSAVAVTLKKLEAEDYIVRYQEGEDARTKHIGLTDKGRELVSRSKELFEQVDKAAFEGFSGEERATLIGYMTRIRDNLNDLRSSGGAAGACAEAGGTSGGSGRER